MTSMNSLDSVLRAGLDAASHSGPTQVEGEKLADARAQVLQGTVATTPLSLQPNDDKFSFERSTVRHDFRALVVAAIDWQDHDMGRRELRRQHEAVVIRMDHRQRAN